jgi:4-hydroxybenzoyl-CoA thioesterase
MSVDILPGISKTTRYSVQVQFGDCDPAGIVFFPNFNKWMDAASLHFFMECGLPPWRELVKTTGIIGTPLLEIHTQFKQAATYGETVFVETCVLEWGRKTVKQQHVVKRADPQGDTVLCVGSEVRAFCVNKPEGGIQAVTVPEFILKACAA